MSEAIKCDCCLRCTPDINPLYSLKKRWVWLKYNFDSQGGSYQKLHLCESCWKAIGDSVKKDSPDQERSEINQTQETIMDSSFKFLSNKEEDIYDENDGQPI